MPTVDHTSRLSSVDRDQRRRLAARTSSFDPDDIDAAFAELDARYLAGEAHPRAHMVGHRPGYAASTGTSSRATTPDWVNIDRRRGKRSRRRRLIARIRYAPCGISRRTSIYIEAVHRADRPRSGRHPRGAWDFARGLRRRWREIALLTVEGDLISQLRAIRRGRRRRRVREVRRAQSTAPLENAATRAWTPLEAYVLGTK